MLMLSSVANHSFLLGASIFAWCMPFSETNSSYERKHQCRAALLALTALWVHIIHPQSLCPSVHLFKVHLGNPGVT